MGSSVSVVPSFAFVEAAALGTGVNLGGLFRHPLPRRAALRAAATGAGAGFDHWFDEGGGVGCKVAGFVAAGVDGPDGAEIAT